MEQAVSRYRFSVEDYHRLVDSGILTENDPVELIRGEIVVKAPKLPPRCASVKRLMVALGGLSPHALQSVHGAVTLADSEPEPDFTLLELKADFYASGHPGSAEVFLVVEVSDQRVAFDRDVKGPLYAENGIREYWLVDIKADAIEIRRRPEDGEYREVRTVRRGETISPEAFPDFEVPVEAVLP